MSRYVSENFPSVYQQDSLNGHIIPQVPTDMYFTDKFVSFAKPIQQQKEWDFDFGVGTRIELPVNLEKVFNKEID